MTHLVLTQQHIDSQFTYTDAYIQIISSLSITNQQLTFNNCILSFEGGCLTSGTINGNNSVIQAAPYQIFDNNLSITGTWTNDIAYFEWFGAKGNSSDDDAAAIQAGLNSIFNTFQMLPKTYAIGTGLTINHLSGDNFDNKIKKHIIGCSMNRANQATTIKAKANISLLLNIQTSGVVLENLIFDGGQNSQYVTNAIAATSQNNNYLKFSNICILYMTGYALDIWGYLCELDKVYVKECQSGIYIHGDIYNTSTQSTTAFLKQCYCESCGEFGIKLQLMNYSTLVSCAVDKLTIGTSYAYTFIGCRNITMSSCGSEQNKKHINIQYSRGISITSLFTWAGNNIQTATDLEKSIYIKTNCYSISFNNCVLGARKSNATSIKLENSTSISFHQCMTRKDTGSEYQNTGTDGPMLLSSDISQSGCTNVSINN